LSDVETRTDLLTGFSNRLSFVMLHAADNPLILQAVPYWK